MRLKVFLQCSSLLLPEHPPPKIGEISEVRTRISNRNQANNKQHIQETKASWQIPNVMELLSLFCIGATPSNVSAAAATPQNCPEAPQHEVLWLADAGLLVDDLQCYIAPLYI